MPADFAIDTIRVRTQADEPRVERTVQTGRDGCFASERLLTLDDAAAHSRAPARSATAPTSCGR